MGRIYLFDGVLDVSDVVSHLLNLLQCRFFLTLEPCVAAVEQLRRSN